MLEGVGPVPISLTHPILSRSNRMSFGAIWDDNISRAVALIFLILSN